MKKLNLFIPQCIITLFLILLLSSCGKLRESAQTFDCDTDDLQRTTEAFIDASNTYANDASLENCRSYKTAAEAYLVNVRRCATSVLNGIQETEELIESLDC